MSNWTEDTVQVNGVQIYYTRTGKTGKAALVILHGITDSGMCWQRAGQALEEIFDVVLVDQRGHGQSQKGLADYSAEAMAGDTAGLIRQLQLGQVFVLGHSMGAVVALVLGGLYPELCRKLILVDPPLNLLEPRNPADTAGRERMEAWKQQTIENQRLSIDELEAMCQTRSPHWHDLERRPWAEAKKRVDPEVLTGFQVKSAKNELLAKVICQTLLVFGDKEKGSIIDHDRAEQFTRELPAAEAAYIVGAGHSIQRDAFDALMAEVKAFTRRAVLQ